MPSVFKWDEVIVITDAPWQPTVAYPARGLGSVWEPRRGTGDAALARLIGRTRAQVLAGDQPAVHDLARPQARPCARHRVGAPRGVRDAGMAVGERHRHEIRYRRTELGDAVVRAR